MIYIHTRCHMQSSNGSLVIAIQQQPKYRLHAATKLFYSLQK